MKIIPNIKKMLKRAAYFYSRMQIVSDCVAPLSTGSTCKQYLYEATSPAGAMAGELQRNSQPCRLP